MATLILICGLPGAGKTTLAKQLAATRPAIRFCPDEWIKSLIQDESNNQELTRLRDPVEALQWSVAADLLKQGVSVILENGFWTKQERCKFQSLGKTIGARVELHYLDVPKEELWRRIAERIAPHPATSPPTHPPSNAPDRSAEKYSSP